MAATCSAVCHGSAAGTSDLPLAFTSKPSPASSSAEPGRPRAAAQTISAGRSRRTSSASPG